MVDPVLSSVTRGDQQERTQQRGAHGSSSLTLLIHSATFQVLGTAVKDVKISALMQFHWFLPSLTALVPTRKSEPWNPQSYKAWLHLPERFKNHEIIPNSFLPSRPLPYPLERLSEPHEVLKLFASRWNSEWSFRKESGQMNENISLH